MKTPVIIAIISAMLIFANTAAAITDNSAWGFEFGNPSDDILKKEFEEKKFTSPAPDSSALCPKATHKKREEEIGKKQKEEPAPEKKTEWDEERAISEGIKFSLLNRADQTSKLILSFLPERDAFIKEARKKVWGDIALALVPLLLLLILFLSRPQRRINSVRIEEERARWSVYSLIHYGINTTLLYIALGWLLYQTAHSIRILANFDHFVLKEIMETVWGR